jgi:hypothetical protein
VSVSVDISHPGALVNGALIGTDGPGPAGAVAAMRAIGDRWVRTDVSFEATVNGHPVYDCRTGAWDPSLLDQRVARIRAEGASPLLIVDYTPPCLASLPALPVPGLNPSYSPPDLGAGRARWDDLVARMASHEILAEGVRAFEIWNEPDGFFWTGTLAAYLLLYADTSRVLAAVAARLHRKVEIGGAGLLFADAMWIEPLLATVSIEHLPLDFLSWHWYANYPLFGPMTQIPLPQVRGTPYWYNPLLRAQTFGAQVELVRAEVAKYPLLHPRLWLDEWNVDAGYDPRQAGPFGGALAAAALDSVQQAGLDRMCFFFTADEPANPLGNWGLLDAALRPTPAYEAMRYWHALAGRLLPVALLPDQSLADPSGRVGVVASRAGARVTVLVYNFVAYDPTGGYGAHPPTPYDHVVRVRLAGLAGRSTDRGTWSEQLVDGHHPGGVVAAGTVDEGGAVTIHLPGEAVALLTFSPSPAIH